MPTIHILSDLVIGVLAFRFWKRKDERLAVDVAIFGVLCFLIATGR